MARRGVEEDPGHPRQHHTCKTVFMPDAIIRRIVEKAHICSTRDRTRAVIGAEWSHFDECADDLMEYIGRAMKGYTSIIVEWLAEQKVKLEVAEEETDDMLQDLEHFIREK